MKRDEPAYPSAPRSTTFAEGVEFQDHVCIRLARRGIILQNLASKKYQYSIGENLQGFEIKYDGRCTGDRGTKATGRLSIEIAEKSSASNEEWVSSGIYRTDNAWLYIQGNYQCLWVFGKKQLRKWYEHYRPSYDESYGTVRKFYIELPDANKLALAVIDDRVAAEAEAA